MKAILIDPFTKTITEVEHNGDYKQIYELIGCYCFTAVNLDNKGNAVYVDDNGLIEDIDNQQFFMIFNQDGVPAVLAGKGLILGCDAEGESVSTTISLEAARSIVAWRAQSQALKYFKSIGF
jgi:hypothetical protein